jgi:hypothetical protein
MLELPKGEILGAHVRRRAKSEVTRLALMFMWCLPISERHPCNGGAALPLPHRAQMSMLHRGRQIRCGDFIFPGREAAQRYSDIAMLVLLCGMMGGDHCHRALSSSPAYRSPTMFRMRCIRLSTSDTLHPEIIFKQSLRYQARSRCGSEPLPDLDRPSASDGGPI